MKFYSASNLKSYLKLVSLPFRFMLLLVGRALFAS